MSKYLYVDSEGRVCRIDADTGAMIPIEWETAEERSAKAIADLYGLGRQQRGNMAVFGASAKEFAQIVTDIDVTPALRGTARLRNCYVDGPKGPTGTPGPVGVYLSPEMIRAGAQILDNKYGALPSEAESTAAEIYLTMRGIAPVAT